MHAWEGWGHSMYPVIYPNSEKKKNGFSVSYPSSPIYSTMPSHFLWIANIVSRIYVKKYISATLVTFESCTEYLYDEINVARMITVLLLKLLFYSHKIDKKNCLNFYYHDR